MNGPAFAGPFFFGSRFVAAFRIIATSAFPSSHQRNRVRSHMQNNRGWYGSCHMTRSTDRWGRSSYCKRHTPSRSRRLRHPNHIPANNSPSFLHPNRACGPACRADRRRVCRAGQSRACPRLDSRRVRVAHLRRRWRRERHRQCCRLVHHHLLLRGCRRLHRRRGERQRCQLQRRTQFQVLRWLPQCA
jgi:hypothetical protein